MYMEEKKVFNENSFIIGIDLGTTNSVISYYDFKTGKIVPINMSFGFGKVGLPSVVQYREDTNEWVIGEEALRSYKLYKESTVISPKTKLGTNTIYTLGDKQYTPEDIVSKIVTKLLEGVYNINHNAEIEGVVVTVPYDFDDSQRKATIKALEISGIKDKLLSVIEEPKACALTHSMENTILQNEKILVFDFGGGTLDITIFEVEEKSENEAKVTVISEGGSANFGGDYVDDLIANYCFEEIFKKTGKRREDLDLLHCIDIEIKAKEAKERLTGAKQFRIHVTFTNTPFAISIKKEDLENLIKDFKNQTRKYILDALREGYNGTILPCDIDKVLLEGGSSYMPFVKDIMIDIFNDEKKIFKSLKPSLDISIGATYYGLIMLNVFKERDIITINKNGNIAFESTIPHDIGLKVLQNDKYVFFNMIKRGTPFVLSEKSHTFTLFGDNTSEFTIEIFEKINKKDTLDKCTLVGIVTFFGLPKRPSGKSELEVTLMVNEKDGTVSGKVIDKGYKDEYLPSGFHKTFDPSIYDITKVRREN